MFLQLNLHFLGEEEEEATGLPVDYLLGHRARDQVESEEFHDRFYRLQVTMDNLTLGPILQLFYNASVVVG
jgi:hypothetical protein